MQNLTVVVLKSWEIRRMTVEGDSTRILYCLALLFICVFESLFVLVVVNTLNLYSHSQKVQNLNNMMFRRWW